MSHPVHMILLVLAPIGSLALAVGILFDRRHVYVGWAKVASVLAFLAGAAWSILSFILMDWHRFHITRKVYSWIVGPKSMLAGIAIGFTLSIIMARPYHKRDAVTPNA
jgi:hypothetical protein